MQAALREVAAEIDRVIADDAFPETVQPAFLRDSVRDYPGRGGKRLRPALLLWCCGLLGGELRRAWLPAAAVEVWHNWTLVHDDIIDRDALRRGVPTAHCRLRDAVTAIPLHQDGAEAAVLLPGLVQDVGETVAYVCVVRTFPVLPFPR